MTQRTGSGGATAKDDVYRCLADHRRRRILATLFDQSSPFAVDDLARRIAAVESDVAPDDVHRNEAEAILVDLKHVQLPMLADADLVEWDREEDTVSDAAHSVLDDPAVTAHVRTLDASWDPIVSALAHRRRRLALSIASRRGEPLEVRELARAIADRERDNERKAGAKTSFEERTHTSLHHRHLPALDDAGLLEYDRADGTVAVPGGLDVDGDWFERADRDPSEDVGALVTTP